MLQTYSTPLKGLVIIEPRVFEDDRGYFFESFNLNQWRKAGIQADFIQDNEARSTFGVLRGLHYQLPPFEQAKLVRVIEGEVLDVAVDMRSDSPTYGEAFSIRLSAANKLQLFVPRGFAHGYLVLSPTAIFAYKVDNHYAKASEGGIYYADTALGIDWGVAAEDILLSDKDRILPAFAERRML